MPYIKQDMRDKLDPAIKEFLKHFMQHVPDDQKDGCMNYCLCEITNAVYGQRYFEFNRMIGMLECVKQEIYRRRITPYENQKILENGDLKDWAID